MLTKCLKRAQRLKHLEFVHLFALVSVQLDFRLVTFHQSIVKWDNSEANGILFASEVEFYCLLLILLTVNWCCSFVVEVFEGNCL